MKYSVKYHFENDRGEYDKEDIKEDEHSNVYFVEDSIHSHVLLSP